MKVFHISEKKVTSHRVIAIPYIMPPDGTTTFQSMPIDHPDAPDKHARVPSDSRPNLHDTSTASASAPHDVCPLPSPPLQPGNRNMQKLNMKSEADRRKTYEKWPVPFMDKDHLSAAGFFFTNRGDVVRCAFCGVEVGRWEEGDDAFRDHQRWSPSCGFIKGLIVGNIPIGSDGQPGTSSSLPSSSSSSLPSSSSSSSSLSFYQGTTHSYDVCGPYMELRPNSGPEQGRLHYLYIMVPLSMCESGII